MDGAKDHPAVSWDFESGLAGWTATGDAFDDQPTYGDNVVVSRLGRRVALGGDYWDVPGSVGHRGSHWIGTYEARPSPKVPAGTVAGDGRTGTLTSAPFLIEHNYVSFLVGGGGDISVERIELVITHESAKEILGLQEIGALPAEGSVPGQERPPPVIELGLPVEPVVAITGDMPWDDLGVTVRTGGGHDDERLRRDRWEVAVFKGWHGCVRIVDLGTGPWCHINVDDLRFHD